MDNIFKDQDLGKIQYFRVTDLWKRLCEKHNELFDITTEEYSLLLQSQLELLDEKVKEKEIIILEIGRLDTLRKELIREIKDNLNSDTEISDFKNLIRLMYNYENSLGQSHLERFNKLLVDIIEKIQAQNKKNQLFLNKAIHSLQVIRQEARGGKSYSTYNSKGSSRTIGVE